MSLQTSQIKFFADFIRQELGIIYLEENFFQLEKRLGEIAKQLELPGPEQLFVKAQSGITGFFKQMLLDVATNNETSFFRDPKAFNAIEKHIIPMIFQRTPKP